jgi:broad specificity phosphatase PhoE
MPLIYLVRHGLIAEASPDPDDPVLGAEGLEQANAVARQLQARLPAPLGILSSPLQRCRQTAQPLAALWQAQPRIEPRVSEVPSPPGTPREPWLKQALVASWPELERQDRSGQLAAWRQGVREAVLACREDTVIFSHYVPINSIVGLATRQNQVRCFRPDNASVTVVETGDGAIRLIELGHEKGTRVV